MRWLLLAGLLLSSPSLALGNPVVMDIFAFDFGGGSACIWPQPGETFTVTLLLDQVYDARYGIYGISFLLHRTFGGELLAVHNLYASVGGLVIGNPEVAPGFAMTVGPVCRGATYMGGEIPFATLEYLYTGPPGTITPAPHGLDGAVFADCDNEIRGWWPGCVAGVGMIPPAGCGVSAVRDVTWGAIKALYQ
ncbi:MAG: hypothetical protein FJ279_24340 [Planctomycetes bacterium]|nr:hypothetical protein [Planctomycetota bacterium]